MCIILLSDIPQVMPASISELEHYLKYLPLKYSRVKEIFSFEMRKSFSIIFVASKNLSIADLPSISNNQILH
jgi:hypothetical protein